MIALKIPTEHLDVRTIALENGTVLVGSDAHIWPGKPNPCAGKHKRATRRSPSASAQSTAAVNRTYMSRLEKGASYPGLEIIAKLAAALEVEPAELLRVPLAPRSTSPIVSWVALRPMVGALAVIVRW
jgi:hypothetical protein